MWQHLADRPFEPQYGDDIELCGPDGTPNNTWSRVKQLVSEAKDEQGLVLFEVVDNRNQIIVISAGEDHWQEVEVDA